MFAEKPMVVCGLCGGIGSGKSLVAGLMSSLGAVVFDADRAGHAVLLEAEVKQLLVERWGQRVLNSDGEIDRQVVAGIVFGQQSDAAVELAFLQSISHPRIKRELYGFVEAMLAESVTRTIVVDAALLFEAGWDECCTSVMFIDCHEQIRLQRCRDRGWSDDEINRRIMTQQSLQSKRARSDFVIDNSGSAETTLQQLREIWTSLAA